MKDMEMIRMNLQLFAEGGAGASGTGDGGSAAGSQGAEASADTGAQVQTVSQNSASDAQGTPDKPSFEQLIKGEYKKDYDSNVQKIVQNRLKGVKGKADAYDRAAPLLEAVAQRYGIQDTTNVDALMAAFDSDTRFLEAEAMEKGIPVEQLAALKRAQNEAAMYRRQLQQAQMEQQSREQVERWSREAEELKTIYPELDLAAEIQNPEFAKLLQANVGVKTAYQAIHGEDIMQAAMAAAVRKAEQKVAASVAAGKGRPAESGAGGSGGAVAPKTNVNAMGRAEIQDVMRRVARGERISFG